MIATQDIDDIIGAEAVGPDNDKIGKVGQVYIDRDNEQPVWVSVKGSSARPRPWCRSAVRNGTTPPCTSHSRRTG